MKLKLRIVLLLAFIVGVHSAAQATVREVTSTLDSGPGTLREQVALSVNGDTIFINIKGTISLQSPIAFDNVGARTIIGPYPKHNTITTSGAWSGSLFEITSSGPLIFSGLGFSGGNGNTRHVSVTGSSADVTFNYCLFEGNNLGTGDKGTVIFLDEGTLLIKNSSIIGNSGESSPVFAESGAQLTCENTTFSGNSATNSSGAIRSQGGGPDVFLRHCTIVYNTGNSDQEALRFSGSSDVTMQNCAIGYNGTSRQIKRDGGFTSDGGNRFRENSGAAEDDVDGDLVASDDIGEGLDFELRGEILTDGYGLKYWPIISSSSDLINTSLIAASTPDEDCRRAPRALKGPAVILTYPDAGAVEYTHLRVTNTDGGVTTNSFLWTLEGVRRKDNVSFVEFDIPGTPDNIDLTSTAVLDGGTYIISGFSQPNSAIPGPKQTALPGLTPAFLPITINNNSSVEIGVQADEGASKSSINGIRVIGFNKDGIFIDEEEISVFGCEIGINEDESINGNEEVGLRIFKSNCTIGGWEHWMRNVITGNGIFTVEDRANLAFITADNKIYGNIIGGAPDGVTDITLPGTTLIGIYCAGGNNEIGSSLFNTGNIIVKNTYGIYFNLTGDSNTIQRNNIGIGYDDFTALGNTAAGFILSGSDFNLIGSTNTELGNRIAHNGSGIVLITQTSPAIENSILGNAIYSNTEQGIDFDFNAIAVDNDGLTNADEQNNGLDYPELIASVTCAALNTETEYQLSVPTGEDYRIEFFTVTSPDATNGEGENFIGTETVTVTSNPQTFTFDHGEIIPDGTTISSTVTQLSSGNTSEFSTNATVISGGSTTIDYGTVCPGDSPLPVLTGVPGGSYRFSTPLPVDGATIDEITGAVSGAVEGTTYTVIYEVATCSDEDTTMFTVETVDSDFTFPDFCEDSTGEPTVINMPGGIFSFDTAPGDGATINAATGEISGAGLSGTTYSIRYTVTVSGCTEMTVKSVAVLGEDPSFTMPAICPGETPSDPATVVTPGGTFTFDSPPGDGATLNATTGALSNSTEGASYDIRYTVGPCDDFSVVTVNIISTDATFSFDNICPGESGTPYDIGTPGGSFSYTYPGGFDGSVMNPSTGTLSGGVEGTTYAVVYTVGACDKTDTVEVTITTVNEGFVYDDVCPGETGSPTSVNDASGVFSLSPDPGDGVLLDAATGELTNGVEGETYTIQYAVTTDGCTESTTQNVTITPTDETFTMADFCASNDPSPTPTAATPGGVYSFTTAPADGATINSTTGAISNSTIDQNYEITYTVGSCDETSSITVATFNSDPGFSFDAICPGENGTPYDIASPGGTFSLVAPGAATINATTGELSGGVEGTTYEVVYEESTCNLTDTVAVTVVTVVETFSFANFCKVDESPAPVTDGLSGTFALIDLGDGSSINTVTGVIANPVEGTTYTVMHTATNMGCSQTATENTLVISVDESFSFDPICPEESGLPYDIATLGGIFSFATDAGDDAILNPTTGELTEGEEATTYMVRYLVNDGGCTDSLTLPVLIKTVEEGFDFPDFCVDDESPAPEVDETGGVFSFGTPPADGETISASTGVITDPVEGSLYVVVYTKTTDGCTQDSTINVEVLVVDSDFEFENFCMDEVSPAAEPPEGTYAFEGIPGGGETIDALTGVISNPVEGSNYTISRTVTEGGCTEQTLKTVEVVLVEEEFTFDDFCPAAVSPAPVPVDPDGTFSFGGIVIDGATINPSDGVISNPVEGTTYTVVHSVTEVIPEISCSEDDTLLVTVIATDERFSFEAFCAEFTGIPFGIETPGGIFAFAPDLGDGALLDPATGFITNGNPGTAYTIEYTVGVCNERDTVTTLALASEDAAFTVTDHCANESEEAAITGDLGGTFILNPLPADGTTIDTSNGVLSNSPGGIYTIEYQTSGTASSCPDTTQQMITLFEIPEIISLTTADDVCCPGEAYNPLEVTDATLTAQIYWYRSDVLIDSTFSYLPDTLYTGLNSFGAQPYSADGCYGEIETLTYLLSDTSGMRASPDVEVCLGSPAEISAFGGTSYEWTTNTPLTDATNPDQTIFSLTEEDCIVAIKNNEDCEVLDTTRISFLPTSNCQIEVFNAFSPNEDGTNDFWYIEHLINFTPNTVYIYNRWGDLLNEFENYDNVTVYWDGTNRNGSALPPGTYFYVVITEDNNQNQGGWVELVR